MGRKSIHPRPDYVQVFKKPPHTEIKFVNGHWYLYETIVVSPASSKSIKKSGPILGAITPDGFKESRARKRESTARLQQLADVKMAQEPGQKTPAYGSLPVHGKAADSLEVGAASYFYERTYELRCRLKQFFPDIWSQLYVVCLLRTIYEAKFRRLKTHYQCSILSELFPCIDLGPLSVRNLLLDVGKRRAAIRSFMLEDVTKDGIYLLVDGHRLITASKGRDLPEQGYDSKMRYKDQINLLYIFSLDEGTGIPAYYKQYSGSTPDVTAFEDILKDCGLDASNVIAVTDKGFVSGEDFDLLVESGLQYVVPLKRGNRFVKDRIPATPTDYEQGFTYNGRAIVFSEIPVEDEEGFRIFLYCDTTLYKDEFSTIMSSMEKKNNTIEARATKEKNRRSKGKGKLTDKQLSELRPISLSEAFDDKASIGTITLRVRGDSLNGQQAFCIWKTRQAIEQHFKTYDVTLDFDDSYMREDITEEGRLFLNHLSSMITMSSIDEIYKLGLSKQISVDDLRIKLRKIHADIIEGEWMVKPIKSEVENLCRKLKIDVADLSAFDGILKWKRNPDIVPVNSTVSESDQTAKQ